MNRPPALHSIEITEKLGTMEAGDTKEQEKNQQINGLQQKSEMIETAFEGGNEAGKAETAEKRDRKFAEEIGKEVDEANEAEKAKGDAGNEVHGAKEAGETEAAGIEAKQKEESTEGASESEKGTASKASQKEQVVKENSQPEAEGVSETKNNVSGKPEDLEEEEGGKADVLKKNAKEEVRIECISNCNHLLLFFQEYYLLILLFYETSGTFLSFLPLHFHVTLF